MPSLRSLIFDHAEPQLVSLMGLIRRTEEFLGPNDDWVEDDRRLLFEALDGVSDHPFIFEKGTEDYVTTAHASSDAVEVALDKGGYHRNTLSTRKYREHHDGGRQWAVGSWVVDGIESEDSEYVLQHHVYLFEAPNGGTDIYAHLETSVTEGAEHITETNQVHGDPNHRARDPLDAAGIDYSDRGLNNH